MNSEAEVQALSPIVLLQRALLNREPGALADDARSCLRRSPCGDFFLERGGRAAAHPWNGR
jgi:hypothetical protein